MRVAAKGAVIGAEIGEAARATTANIFSFGREDKEDIVDARGPTLHLLGMRYFALYLSIRQSSRRIGGRILPGTSKNSAAREATTAIFVLRVVMIQRRTTYITEIAQNQTIVRTTHK